MNQNFNSKVLLSLYKKLPFELRENEKSLLKRTHFKYAMQRRKNCLELVEEMIEINNQKIVLINLKVLIEKAIVLMSDKDKKLIYYRFIKGLKFVNLADKFNVSLRQIFRLYDRAVTNFSDILEYLKYPLERIEKEFGMLNIYQMTVAKMSRDFGIIENNKDKIIIAKDDN